MLPAPDATKGGVDEEEGRASWWLFQFLAILRELVLGLFVFGRTIPRRSSAANGAAWRSYVDRVYLLISPEIALVAAAATSVRGSDYTITKSSKIKTNESPSSSVQSLEQRRVLSGYVDNNSNIGTARDPGAGAAAAACAGRRASTPRLRSGARPSARWPRCTTAPTRRARRWACRPSSRRGKPPPRGTTSRWSSRAPASPAARRPAPRGRARTAAALKAPPLVDAWLDVLATEAPPIYSGFGVDADAGAAKLYVQNRDGAALPQLPAAAEAALPPVFGGSGTREPLLASLEWRVGEATTALRQYAVGATSDGTPLRARQLPLRRGGQHRRARGGGRRARGIDFDVAATGFFQADPAPPARAEDQGGLAFDWWPNVDALASIFEAYGVDATRSGALGATIGGRRTLDQIWRSGAAQGSTATDALRLLRRRRARSYAQPAAPRGVGHVWPGASVKAQRRRSFDGSRRPTRRSRRPTRRFRGRAGARCAHVTPAAAAVVRNVPKTSRRGSGVASGGFAALGHAGQRRSPTRSSRRCCASKTSICFGTNVPLSRSWRRFPSTRTRRTSTFGARAVGAPTHTDTTDVVVGAEIYVITETSCRTLSFPYRLIFTQILVLQLSGAKEWRHAARSAGVVHDVRGRRPRRPRLLSRAGARRRAVLAARRRARRRRGRRRVRAPDHRYRRPPLRGAPAAPGCRVYRRQPFHVLSRGQRSRLGLYIASATIPATTTQTVATQNATRVPDASRVRARTVRRRRNPSWLRRR